MKKIILILIFTFSSLHSENAASDINEYKVDLYYANGIMMMESEAKALKVWNKQLNELIFFNHPELQRFIGKKGIAYNLSDGMVAQK